MRTKKPDHPHWRYFLNLSAELQRLGQFVEFHEDNFKTYSLQFLRLYLSVGSEVDVVAKQLCIKLAPAATPEKMPEYRKLVLGIYPDFPKTKVVLPSLDITITPWNEWSSNKSPTWWGDYNAVKHNRALCFDAANLENCINSLSGLLTLLGYLYADALTTCKLRTDDMFTFDRSYFCGSNWGPSGLKDGFALPGIPKPKREDILSGRASHSHSPTAR